MGEAAATLLTSAISGFADEVATRVFQPNDTQAGFVTGASLGAGAGIIAGSALSQATGVPLLFECVLSATLAPSGSVLSEVCAKKVSNTVRSIHVPHNQIDASFSSVTDPSDNV
jgi:hypothetical protein